MLDELLFNSKHWQLFLVFLVVALLSEVAHFQLNILVVIVYLIWLPLLGIRLSKLMPNNYRGYFYLFLAGWLILTVLLVATYIEAPTPLSALYVPGFFILGFGSDLTTFGFYARAIKSLETQDRATENGHYGDLFLFLIFFPLGLWFIQPRLNLLYKQFFRE